MNSTLSIITATFNAASTVADCLKSVASQTHRAEHFLIDGASTDTTLEIVRRIAPANTRIISEPDHGIYDAMNKGIALATGEIIGILNADDFYASPDVLSMVAKTFDDPTVMSCYGDLEYVKSAGARNFSVVRYWKSGRFTSRSFYWGWMPPHPAFFVRKSVYEQHGLFNLNLGSAADYELMLRLLLKERISSVYIPEVLVRMRIGGASNRNFTARLAANRMDRKAWEINGLMPYPWTLLCKPVRKIGQYLVRR
ncbi:MAG: glycosyl transferase [Geobacteraceae bacterium GWC2_53_11]|nr:MAG: glycosyl transferase [Geobacteraceae bacterium GWC2_53_11]